MQESKSNITIGSEATEGMLKGIKRASQAIRLTYGPKGMNAVVENQFYPFAEVANDAQTIVQAIEVTDPIEKRGLGFLKELMDKAERDSGDGRKTTAIMAEEILERGMSSGVKGVELKRELDALIPTIEKHINDNKKIITEKEVSAVATIAGESEVLGHLLGEIYQRIGKDGIIIPEGSGTFNTSYSIIEGVRFIDTGYLSPYMVHDETAVKDGLKENQAVYENPTILVTKNKISRLSDIDPLLATMFKQGKKDLIIFTDDMDSDVARTLINNHVGHKSEPEKYPFNILIIKAPTLWKQYVFEDFAKVTGSTIVEDSSGINFKNMKLEHLGTCDRITVDKEETTIVGGVDISDHVANLKKDDSTDSKLRLSWLQTKTAILKLGANNESELSYIRLKCRDAISASRLALRDGVVQGGGVALKDASLSLPDTVAGNMLKEALQAPIKQLCFNSGINVPDSFGDEIIDAAAIIKNAVRNAISLASTVLTTGIVITISPKSAEQIAAEALQGKKLRF